MDQRPEWIDRFRSDTLPRAHTDDDYWRSSSVRFYSYINILDYNRQKNLISSKHYKTTLYFLKTSYSYITLRNPKTEVYP